MSCVRAAHAGFCSGVRRAVDLATAAAAEARRQGVPCLSLGEVVHNSSVTGALAALGVRVTDTIGDAAGGLLILRSHGVSPAVLAECKTHGIQAVDCTCPRVEALHRAVHEHSQSGAAVILIGESEHPEVKGTAGWCSGPVWVVSSEEDIASLPPCEGALIACQTTLPIEKWQHLLPLIRQKAPGAKELCSICGATRVRQQAARELAAKCDVMVVVGSRQSANTVKLAETCRALCPDTILTESAAGLPSRLLHRKTDLKIGITAGASTPEWSIEEVFTTMNDIENKDQVTPVIDENDFAASIDATMTKLHKGQTVTGRILQITEDEVGVDVHYKSDGILKRSDMVDQDVQVGDEIEVEVVSVNDKEGNVILSQRNIINKKAWDALMAKHEAGEYVEGVAKEAVKGGLICMVDGVRAFVPASRLAKRFVEKIDQYVGQTMKLKIIDVDAAKKRIVCSRKDVILEEEASKKAAAWEKIEEGAVLTGVVRRFTDFGAFVDLGGVDGLIHITDLAWYRVGTPAEVLQKDQEVQVKVLSVDRERERIQLGYKQLQDKPWDHIEEKYPVGLVLERKVVRICPFGAFIALEPGVDGLVHISEIALERVAKVEDKLTKGQNVTVAVLGVDPEAKRISLSIKRVLEEEAAVAAEAAEAEAVEAPVEE
ncbi:MAG: bifunctional 4-hydroxy-3-methylbut-2-enyl diphosphate reductase/30S ribosomal protein S1 [Clostridia bacterium]|nr:bifunctional 4-hydroxy-3-methylbut-2-enyl diphosphate reductase/30S ribosomal protein S1 [Clostridia bacterium]